MAAGFPVKANYASGDVLTAAQMNDLAGTLNYLDPTAKGDLFPASSGTALTRLAVGANDTVLTADSSTATGLKWAAAGGGGPTGWTLLNAGGTAMTGAATITVSGLSAKEILVLIIGAKVDTLQFITARLNTDSGANYTYAGNNFRFNSTYSAANFGGAGDYSGSTSFALGRIPDGSSGVPAFFGSLYIDKTDTNGWKAVTGIGGGNQASGNIQQELATFQGIYEASAAITSVSIISSNRDFTDGRIYVMGAN
jgi:hypothetical protein